MSFPPSWAASANYKSDMPMSKPVDTVRDQQFAFAAHLRDSTQPAPPGIESRRMAVYRDLFRNTIESLLSSNFPVIRKALEYAEWNELVDTFHREHRCTTPLFTEVAQEFIGWLADNDTHHLPWLPELAHYEWMELRAQIDDADPIAHDPQGDLLQGIPLLSPQAWPLAYAWPVDRIGPTYRPQTPPASPSLTLVRRAPDMQVHFAALSPLAFRLLQWIEGSHTLSGNAIIEALADEAGLPDDATFTTEAQAMLHRLHIEGTVIGTRTS